MLRASCVLALLASYPVFAQPAFEVVSIKPSQAAAGNMSWHSTPGLIRMQGQTLKSCVRIAYILREPQVTGGPKWADSEAFDITAKAAGPADDPELLAMLQTMLAREFHLEFHRETKATSGFALVQAKGGLKIHPVEPGQSKTSSGRGRFNGQRTPMERLARFLTSALGEPVSDETGAKGVYDMSFEWTPEEGRALNPGETAPPATGPSIFTVLQDKLGLKLEPRKIPLEVLVIDRAEKPSMN